MMKNVPKKSRKMSHGHILKNFHGHMPMESQTCWGLRLSLTRPSMMAGSWEWKHLMMMPMMIMTMMMMMMMPMMMLTNGDKDDDNDPGLHQGVALLLDARPEKAAQ